MQMLARFKASLQPGGICPNWLALTSFDSVLGQKKQETACGLPKERSLKENLCSFMKLRIYCFNLGTWRVAGDSFTKNLYNGLYRVTFPMLSCKISSQEYFWSGPCLVVPTGALQNLSSHILLGGMEPSTQTSKIHRLKFQSTWDLSKKKKRQYVQKTWDRVSKSQQK